MVTARDEGGRRRQRQLPGQVLATTRGIAVASAEGGSCGCGQVLRRAAVLRSVQAQVALPASAAVSAVGKWGMRRRGIPALREHKLGRGGFCALGAADGSFDLNLHVLENWEFSRSLNLPQQVSTAP